METASAGRSPELATVIANLATDATTIEVLGALRDEGIEAILMRGPAIARLLYDHDGERAYCDSDVLVAPGDFSAAGRVLERLGFERRVGPAGGPPVFGGHHADPWRRASDAAEVDLHRTVVGFEAPASEAWAVLRGGAQALRLGSFEATVLDEPARALVVALHAAQHGPRRERPLEDLDRALERIDARTWAAADGLAERLEARPALAAGLRRRPRGARVADELGLPSEFPVDVALRAGAARYMSFGFERIAAARGPVAKLQTACSALVPAPAYMRTHSRLANRGAAGLAAAYIARAARIPVVAVPAFSAWRRARRRSTSRP